MNQHARDFTSDEYSSHFGPVVNVPESLEAEQQLLGAIMMNNAALDAIKVPLDAKHFYEPLHRKIFAGMQELRSEGKRINPVSLKGYVAANDRVGDMTVSEYMGVIAGAACSVVLASQFASDIMKAAVAREALQVIEQVREAANNHWGELGFADEIIKFTEQLRTRAEELAIKENIRPGDAYMNRFNNTTANPGSAGVAIKMPELRRVMNEDVFEAGNLYGLLSSSGEGKTSLTIQVMLDALNAGHPVLLLSYDQSQSQCVAQMIAQKYGIDAKQQKSPDMMSQWEQDQSIQFATWLNSQPIDIIRCHREGNKRLIAYASNFVAKHKGGKRPLIVIDHIKKIKPRDERMTPDKISAEITVEWKSFADETKSAVLMLNQRNTEGTKRLNPRPISRDIYGGEGAKEDYDAIVYLYRPEKYRKDMLATVGNDRERAAITQVFAEFGPEIETVAEIGVIKSRFGDTSITERLKFEARYTRYVSMAPDREKELF